MILFIIPNRFQILHLQILKVITVTRDIYNTLKCINLCLYTAAAVTDFIIMLKNKIKKRSFKFIIRNLFFYFENSDMYVYKHAFDPILCFAFLPK